MSNPFHFIVYARVGVIVLVLLVTSGSAGPQPKIKSDVAKPVASGSAEPQTAKESVTKPVASIFFERQTIRENDSVAVSLWFSNEGNLNLKEVELFIEAPDFLSWQDESCQSAIGKPLSLGPVKANSVLTRKLCIKTGSDVSVGSFNIAFSFAYRWEANGLTYQSVLVSEKTLASTLFGSDTVAGVPLNLAGFVVPGLFFWLVLSLLKVPGSMQLPLGDKMIYSVVVSIGIVGLAGWFKRIDTSGGIGIVRLARLAAVGIVLGLAVSGGYYVARAVRRRRARTRVIDAYDDPDVVLEKILRQNLRLPRTYSTLESLHKKNENRPWIAWILKKTQRLIPRYDHHRVVVHLKEGGSQIGSMSATNDGSIWLAGWFQINIDGKSDVLKKKFRGFEAENNPIGMIRLARAEHIEVESRQLIRVREDGKPEHPGDQIFQFDKDKVARMPREENDEIGAPIVLVEQQ